jgi:hypothetical protein
MSTLWTPDGERPVSQPSEPAPGAPAGAGPGALGDTGVPPQSPAGGEPDEAEMLAHLDELRQQLAGAPAEAVVANHAYGLFELAAVHLSVRPPQLDQARLAIDALAAVVEGLGDRLGEAYPQLSDGLAQLRMAFVQIQVAAGQEASGGEPGGQ